MTLLRMRALLALVSVVAAVSTSALSAAQPSDPVVAGPSLVAPGSGVDISFPQCLHTSHVEFPAGIPFAVVGVNGGSAFNENPCFASEYNSAFLLGGAADQPHAAVYVNTGNPALAGVWWPTTNRTQAGTSVVNPNGSCDSQAGAACAYIYGYSMAQADYRRVSRAPVSMPKLWWLDVETSNTWQPDVVANAASISGMVDYFRSRQLDVGLYSTSYQWNRIAGQTAATSDLAGLPSWLAGGSFHGAPADCEKSPLTPGGRVAMIQYVLNLDTDYVCQRFAETTAAITPAAPSSVGNALTAVNGDWGPSGIAYAYQWNRNGLAIAGATGRTYVPTTLDAGSAITVTITGFASGYSAASDTSAPVAVTDAVL